VSLLWAVPVVAAAVATAVVAARARAIEDEAAGAAADLRRLGELRRPLQAVQAMLRETDALAAELRRRHGTDPEP
jgi:cytochrome c-type biogenesis protein CcmH/NrfF